jgi:hypothetical protein
MLGPGVIGPERKTHVTAHAWRERALSLLMSEQDEHAFPMSIYTDCSRRVVGLFVVQLLSIHSRCKALFK